MPKSLLHGELVVGKQNRVCSKLRFRDVCKSDLKSLNMRTDERKLLANDRAKWLSTQKTGRKVKEYLKKPKQTKKGEENISFLNLLNFMNFLLHYCFYKLLFIVILLCKLSLAEFDW